MKNGIRFQLCIALCIAMLASFTTFAQSSGDVKIGKQIWMSKNLDVSTFRNGEVIPEVKSKAEWSTAGKNKQAAFCYYEYDGKNGKEYGKLYNWYAINDSRGLAPKGYHIPSDEEWKVLIDFLGEVVVEKLKSTTGWTNGGNGTNSSGFNALPGGYYNSFFEKFYRITEYASFWSSSEMDARFAWYFVLDENHRIVSRYNDRKNFGMSVRCIKD